MEEIKEIKDFITENVRKCKEFKENKVKQADCFRDICYLVNDKFGKSAHFDFYDNNISFIIGISIENSVVLKFNKENLKLIEK